MTKRLMTIWTMCMLALLALCTPLRAHAAGDWVQDWFDQSATTSPGSLKTQQRGYYTGGSFQARWRMSNDYPVSVSPPRFSAGCGGIDLFAGGISFMDPEFLVQKLERSIQAAPAIAFQMAMDEYCKACTNAMNTMEQITDYLNSMQMNDCRMAKGLAAVVVPKPGDNAPFQDRLEKQMQDYAISSGFMKNGQSVDDSVKSNAGKSPVNTSDKIADCPAVFRTVFGGGSVIDNVTGLLSLSAYAPLMRGLIGDVNISYDTTYNNYSIVPLDPCKGNDPSDTFDFITGKVEKRGTGTSGTCSVATSTSVQDQISSRLSSVATKLAATGSGGAVLGSADLAFISAAPFSVLNLLRDAVKGNYVDEAVNSSTDILAPAYAAHMLNDVHLMARLVLSTASEVQARASSAATNPQKCDAEFLRPAYETIRVMDDRAMAYRQLALANYQKQLAELNANLQYAAYLQARRKQTVTDDTSTLR